MIEHCCDKAGLSYDERSAKPQELVRPIMETMKAWMESEGVKYSSGSQIGKAVTYAYSAPMEIATSRKFIDQTKRGIR